MRNLQLDSGGGQGYCLWCHRYRSRKRRAYLSHLSTSCTNNIQAPKLDPSLFGFSN